MAWGMSKSTSSEIQQAFGISNAVNPSSDTIYITCNALTGVSQYQFAQHHSGGQDYYETASPITADGLRFINSSQFVYKFYPLVAGKTYQLNYREYKKSDGYGSGISITTASGSGGGGTTPSTQPGQILTFVGSHITGTMQYKLTWTWLQTNNVQVYYIYNYGTPYTAVHPYSIQNPYGYTVTSYGMCEATLTFEANTYYSLQICGVNQLTGEFGPLSVATVPIYIQKIRPDLFKWQDSGTIQTTYTINIAASDWNRLQDNINDVREYVGLSKIPIGSGFTRVQGLSTGTYEANATIISARIYDEVINALTDLKPFMTQPGYVPGLQSSAVTSTGGNIIEAQDFTWIVTALNSIT